MSINIGSQAPAFTLPSSEKNMVNLADFAGCNVVLLFFPFAFTGVCTAEMCHMRDTMANYSDLDATILGISVDSPFTLAKFKEAEKLNFTLLSDFNKTVSAAYNTLYEEFVLELKGVSKRSAFVIDGKGVIQYVEILESAGDQPNYDAINNVLKSLK